MDISPVASSLSQSQGSADVSTSVAKKRLDAAKTEAEQLTAMIKTADPKGAKEPNGLGGMLDLKA